MDISVREQISSFHRRAGSNRRKSTFSANPAAANAYLCLVVASGLATGLAFQLPGTLQPVRRAARASTIGLCKCIHDGKAVSRRSAAAALLLPLLVSRQAAAATNASSGKWAKHYKEFTEEELAGFTKTDSGMQYMDVAEGTGEAPRAGDMVNTHYIGYLLESGNMFDSSYARDAPITFPVGTGRVMKGLDEGVLGMRVGGRRVFILPQSEGTPFLSPINEILSQLDGSCQRAHFKPDVCPTSKLGYGSKGVGPIPRESTLVFYVELLSLGNGS
mmetsp:Transcript_70190/g.102863  ORF Transcript_70190/g.102863 Transcript_70190/m.102863 type:complete len:274 (+) Transcript_70190:189-1010(+)